MNEARAYFMQSARLGYGRWAPGDLELAVTLWGDRRVTRYIDQRTVLTREDVAGRLRAEIDGQDRHGIQYWPLFEMATGQLAGCCGLRPRPDSGVVEFGVVEFGVHVCADFWRRGYALEAGRRVIRHAFDDLHVRAVFAGHNPENSASAALLNRLGFEFTHTELYPPTGLQHPSYTLTRMRYAGVHRLGISRA